MATKTINGEKYNIGENYLKPKKGLCYKYKDGKYYVYWGKFKDGETREGLFNKNGKIYLNKPNKITSSFDSNSLINDILQNGKKVAKNVNNMQLDLTDEEKQDIFCPPIRESNNILIRLIKKELKKQQIPKKELQRRFSSMSEFNNFTRSLIIRDSITIEGFARWMEILDIEWNINLRKKE